MRRRPRASQDDFVLRVRVYCPARACCGASVRMLGPKERRCTPAMREPINANFVFVVVHSPSLKSITNRDTATAPPKPATARLPNRAKRPNQGTVRNIPYARSYHRRVLNYDGSCSPPRKLDQVSYSNWTTSPYSIVLSC